MTAKGFSVAYVAIDPFDGIGHIGSSEDSYSDSSETVTAFPGSLRSIYVPAGRSYEEQDHNRNYNRAGAISSSSSNGFTYGGRSQIGQIEIGGVIGINSGGGGSGREDDGSDSDADNEDEVENTGDNSNGHSAGVTGNSDDTDNDNDDYNDFAHFNAANRYRTHVEELPANRLSAEQFD